ncbi:hypothetical protein Glove_410g28 [Diversispora epigaea]|uniref:Uncharacterized protein n=1 Tax=Diversispora epigaea TaxID=1348612 RepID=A0A397GXZ4_9GLOM|nr:hypothetical protein Glove_410g28 [Diversispora epigaea]
MRITIANTISTQKSKTEILALGNIIENIHYGPFASNWWWFFRKKQKKTDILCIPFRINCRFWVKLNNHEFIVRIIKHNNNNFQPGFINESDPDTDVHFNITSAINFTYQKLFHTETRYLGLGILELDTLEIASQLLADVTFIPFQVKYENITLHIIKIGSSNNKEIYYGGNGYIATFIHKVRGDQCLVVQQIHENSFSITVYRNGIQPVWKQMTIRQDNKPLELFGLCDPIVKQEIKNHIALPICTIKDWDNLEIMQPIFEKNLKKKISTINLGWIQFFLNWKNQKTRIIEFIITLAQIYPSDHQFTERELRVWRRIMKDVGCTNITPFSKDKSQLEFWTYASDLNIDREIIQNLYNDGFLKIKISIPSLNNLSQSYEVTPLNEQKFWNSFQKSLEKNKRGLGGKQRILSIIVEKFGPKELHEKLQVSNHLITSAKHFAQINGPGCSAIDKPKVTRTGVTEIQDAQFHTFFSDKNNVSMSSYSVDAKTGLPILYLKENKQSLWEKFEATYLDGIKRTSFMGRLANGQYVYRKDLGGLCNTGNDYGYVVFDLLITLIQGSLHEKSLKQFLINEFENLRYHLRREFENELVMNIDGTTNHVPCLEYCLLRAFGECNELHKERCENCKQLFIVFQHLEQNLSSEHQQIFEESKEKFTYFLAHQARKKYLNSQYKAQLLDLNEDGAIMIADYKMKILPKSAREKKQEFFGKRGWSLHTILVLTKKTNNIEVQAFDHWSMDTKQDAWFTASSFNVIFETLDPKPTWIKILSDNGAHYHSSELMAIVANWYAWYKIEVPKSLVNSHLATISHAIKRYVRIGHTLNEGEQIETAIENLKGTAVAHIEPQRDHIPVKTMEKVSSLFQWKWPITGDYVGFIQGRPLPHIGNWICFSPEDITKLVERPIHKPTPQISSHTQPHENWIIPLPNFEEYNKINEDKENIQPISTYEADYVLSFFSSGWALRSNQRLEKRGSGKRITERVKEYLVAFFLAGDANKTERMSATEMVNTLNQLSKEGEIKGEDIPQIKTVESWITRYSMSLRQKAAEERIINYREKSLNQPLREKNIRNCSKKNTENLQKRQKRNNPNERE